MPNDIYFTRNRLLDQTSSVSLARQEMDLGSLPVQTLKADTLSTVLKFLKFRPDEIRDLKSIIGTAIEIGSSISSIVGAVGTVVGLAQKLGILGQQEDKVETYLKNINTRVNYIYNFLLQKERRGLFKESVEWRIDADQTREAIGNLKTSRSDNVLDAAELRLGSLSKAISLMLDPVSGVINFSAEAYGGPTSNWVNFATSPLMVTHTGERISLASGSASEIWDAGHYIDVLIYALRERLLATAMLEPPFQGTAYDRAGLEPVAAMISTFVEKWKASILEFDPNSMIGDGGQLYNPWHPYPSEPAALKESIVVGAVDPVTGISSVDTFGEFDTRVSLMENPAGSPWSTVFATDVSAARFAANAARKSRYQQVVQSCGIPELEELAKAYAAAAAPSSGLVFGLPSQLKLGTHPGPALSGPLVSIFEPVGSLSEFIGHPEQITLGDFGAFAGTPGKTYSAERFFAGQPKSTSVKVALRGSRTENQLGYRLLVCGKDIPLLPFSIGGGSGVEGFPIEPIEVTHQFETKVWDVCQARMLSFAEQNRLDVEPNYTLRIDNRRRPGKASVRINVVYMPPAIDTAQSYFGTVDVQITPEDIEQFRDAFQAEIKFIETIVGEDDQPATREATVKATIAPTYLIVEKKFFDDYQKAFEAMLRSAKDLVKEAELTTITLIPPEHPDWHQRLDVLVENGMHWFKSTAEVKPDLVRSTIVNLQLPTLKG